MDTLSGKILETHEVDNAVTYILYSSNVIPSSWYFSDLITDIALLQNLNSSDFETLISDKITAGKPRNKIHSHT